MENEVTEKDWKQLREQILGEYRSGIMALEAHKAVIAMIDKHLNG